MSGLPVLLNGIAMRRYVPDFSHRKETYFEGNVSVTLTT